MRRMLFTNPDYLSFTEGQNTFRKGNKWADLQVGEKIELALTGNGQPDVVVGQARVVGVVVDKLGKLLSRHAHGNHETFLAENADQVLLGILKQIYFDASDDEIFTAIYLDRNP